MQRYVDVKRILLYSFSVSRQSSKPRKADPTTVRLERPLDEWVRQLAIDHPDGQSGVLNDAVRFYRAHVDDKNERLFSTIVNGDACDRG